VNQTGTVELQWLERGLFEALMASGRRLLGDLLTAIAPREIPAAHRRHREKRYRRKRTLVTVLGPVEFVRDYYHCPECSRIPFDAELGILNRRYSPGVRRMMGYAASQGCYRAAARDLRELAGLHIPARSIQKEVLATAGVLARVLDKLESPDSGAIPLLYIGLDGTGAPMRRDALQGRRGRQPDGSARTREVKLACVFTQHGTDAEGLPCRDPNSTSYVANFKSASDFGADVLAEARRRGLARSVRRVVLGDGAVWIWELARANFPDACQILDYYHASEHVHEAHRALFAGEAPDILEQWKGWLWDGRVDHIIQAIESLVEAEPDPDTARDMASHKTYFENNRQRMRYAEFRKEGYFIGSGVVEAGCKTVVCQRLKQSGMFWSVKGAEAILTYRSAVLNDRYDAAWTKNSTMVA